MKIIIVTAIGLMGTATALSQTGIAFSSLEPDGGLLGGSYSVSEQARHMIFDFSDGDIASALQLRLWNHDVSSSVTTTARATIYASQGTPAATPGGVISTITIPLILSPNEDRVVTFDLPDTQLTSNTAWIGLFFPDSPPLTWVTNFSGQSSVGHMHRTERYREDGEGVWGGIGNNIPLKQASVLVVPSPGAVALLLPFGLFVNHRKRQ